jgi:hypothetical protein
MVKYINLTPRWTEILPTFQFLVESVTTRDKPKNGSDPDAVMMNFWNEMKRIAQAADNYGDLLAFVRSEQFNWSDEDIGAALKQGRELNELQRYTIRETKDAE